MLYDILERKNAFLGYKNDNFKKSNNRYFSKGVTPRFCSRIGHLSIFFFIGNLDQEKVFYDILQRKNAFLSYKNKKFKKSKIEIFPNRLTHGFRQILAIFPSFFLRQYRPGKCVLRYSRTKKRLARL